MGSTARLQIDPLKFNQTHPSLTAWRADRHGPNQFGLGFHFGIRNPSKVSRPVPSNHLVQRLGDFGLVDRVREIKIQPGTAITHGAPGNGCINDGAEHMHTAVHPHKSVAPVPVDTGKHFFPDFGRCLPLSDHMQLFPRFGLRDGISNFHRTSVRQDELPGIPRLTAAPTIKDTPIEDDGLIRYSRYPRGAFPKIRIVLIQLFSAGHVRTSPARRGDRTSAKDSPLHQIARPQPQSPISLPR